MYLTTELLLQFFENIGLAVVLTYGLGLIADRISPQRPQLLQAAKGLLFLLLAILCMELPLEIQPGVRVDLRNLMVFLAGPFGGPLAGLFAGAFAGAYRLYLGGSGAVAGTGSILTAAILGSFIGWKYGRLATWKMAAAGGTALFVIGMPWFLAIGDLSLGLSLLKRLTLPYALFYIPGAVLLSALLMSGHRRREAERRAAYNEGRFRDIAEIASDWFWEMDKDLRVTYVSPRLREITGYDIDEFRGKQRRDLVASVSQSELRQHEETLRRREPFRDFSYAMKCKDGIARQVLTSGKPIFDDDGAFLGYRGSGRDISEEARYRRDLETERLKAELANKAKSNFLASMSHELRTPLNAIIGFSEIMDKEMFGRHSVPAYATYSSDIHSSASYLLSLVNDLLDLARVESGRLELEKSSCDLANIAASALRLLQERAKRQGIALTAEIEAALPVAFLDERAVKQVLVNILSNAVKFTPRGGRIELVVRFVAGEGFRIAVSDSGIGIAPEELDLVLQPFRQAEAGRAMSKEGTGLGLALSKAMVEAHGGQLTLHSILGEGTTVEFTLPQKNLPQESLPRNIAKAQGDTPAEDSPRPPSLEANG